MNLSSAISKWASIDPEREAIVDIPTGRRLSFGALESRIDQLCHGLTDAGLVKGDRIAILSRNSIEYFEVYYACARAGLIAQPLNWRLAPEEISRILLDGDPAAFLCESEFLSERNAVKDLLGDELPGLRHLEYGEGSDGSYETLVTGAAW